MDSSNIKGLTDAQVAESRERYGRNVLTPAPRQSAWKAFLKKFEDPLIIILLVAGVLSVCISFYEYFAEGQGSGVFFEPVGIFIAIILATALSFYFEQKADKEFTILNKVNDDEPVQVIRNGHATEIPKQDVVVGDIVILTTGQEIPADGHLLEATSLNVDESSLTGEPIAHKTTDESHFDPEATFPSDSVMRGTNVMEGHGVMKVTAVGDTTENGKVFIAAQIDNSVNTPLNEQLDRLGRVITRISYGVGFTVIAGRIAMYFMLEPFELMDFISYLLKTVMIAVALLVVSVPEGLPMAVTLSLAYSMRRMLKTNNLVRKMHACETMGATTVICTDKTGTLTQNQMQVSQTDFYGNLPQEVIDEAIAINSTAHLDFTNPGKAKVLGNPTEGALLLWLHGRKVDYRSLRNKTDILAELPFSTERKYMATEVRSASGRRLLYVKGAPEIVLGLCKVMPAGVDRKAIDATLRRWQEQALRTLAFAYAEIDAKAVSPIRDGRLDVPVNLTFMGLTAISDPVRADVPAAVSQVLDAGIKIKIVTGDTPATAKEIGRQIGLWNPDTDTDRNIITGVEFAALTDSELLGRVEDLKIIARARPMDKKRLVEALQTRGEVVAVTGDGTNDAPALKAAQVGLSMGDGTSVAKEASDITIVDNSFASIGRAVMWGRSLYRNIQRFILFQMTVNVVACVIVATGAFMGMQSPLTVTQMLWVNLIMDTFAAMALASLPPTSGVMKEKPRPRSAFIINKAMWESILGTGLLFSAILLWVFYYFEHTPLTSLTQFMRLTLGVNTGFTPYELSLFFTIFVFLQFWNMFNARAFATDRSAFHFRGCSGFLGIAAFIVVGQILIVSFGGQAFSVVPLEADDWLIIIISTFPVLLIGEIYRLIRYRHV